MKNIVITGGCSGIGEASVNRFLSTNEYTVIVLDLNKKVGETLNQKNPNAHFYQADVSNHEQVAEVAKRVAADFGSINILLHNAGISIRDKFTAIRHEDWHKVMNTNLHSCYYLVSEFFPFFEEGKGSILFTASTNGIMGYPYYASYNASKAAVISLTKSLALEFAPHIRVNCVCPGYVLTPMQRQEYSDAMLEEVNAKIPMKRHATPEEIAETFFFLASPGAAFITGAAITVDGGEIAGGLASR
jgi:meso-butanediol dehydrogenase/(S,S)-butanediol dehydrogenase/diacetyl reductase